MQLLYVTDADNVILLQCLHHNATIVTYAKIQLNVVGFQLSLFQLQSTQNLHSKQKHLGPKIAKSHTAHHKA